MIDILNVNVEIYDKNKEQGGKRTERERKKHG